MRLYLVYDLQSHMTVNVWPIGDIDMKFIDVIAITMSTNLYVSSHTALAPLALKIYAYCSSCAPIGQSYFIIKTCAELPSTHKKLTSCL